MPKDSPFLLFKVECPICKTINEFEKIRVGAYTEDGRDTDFCPQAVEWRYPRYQAYNPLFFFTATCSNCYYTREFTNDFKDWKSDTNFRTYRLKQVKDKHLEQLSTAESVIKMLGESIDRGRYPNESAITKLLLAVYDELLAEHYSALDLGRFYLRIAWLFRDLEKGENPQTLHLRGMIHELENKYGMLVQSVDGVRDEIGNFSSHIENQFESDQIPVELKSTMLQLKDKYRERVKTFTDAVTEAEKRLEDINALVGEYREETLGSSEDGGEASFGSYPSFTAFLQQVKLRWPKAVSDEREALEQAIHYYKEAYSGGREISPGAAQIQASYLIAELSRRIGDHDEAKRYFTSTIKAGQELIYEHRQDQSRTALARKILELAIEQGRANMAAAKGKG